MMIDTGNATLDQRPKAVDGVGVNIAANVNLGGMVDLLMLKPIHFERSVSAHVVSNNRCVGTDMLFDRGNENGVIGIEDGHSDHVPLPFDHAKNGGFTGCATTAKFGSFVSVHVLSLATYVGFIGFNFAGKHIRVFTKQTANLLEHSPSCFVGNAGTSLKCLSRIARASGGHFKDCLKPSLERCGGLVEDRVSQWRDLVSANVTSVDGPLVQLGVGCNLFADGALNTIWVKVILKPLKASIAIWKHLSEVFFGELSLLGFHFLTPQHLYYSTRIA